MKTFLDCIPCFIRQALEAVRMINDDENMHKEIIKEILIRSSKLDFNDSPPQMSRIIHKYVREVTGCEDAYKQIKIRFNKFAMQLYPRLKEIIMHSDNKFETAVKLSIAGNIIDFGVSGDIDEQMVLNTIKQCLDSNIDKEVLEDFKQSISSANKILYLADNAGEIVFDKLFIESLPYDKITFVVKGAPIINDAIMSDAVDIGITDMVKVIDNGDDAPGTILSSCSKQFLEEFNKADLIISKGQGNYETLSEVENKNIYFLFKVKCPIISRDAGQEMGALVIKNTY